MTGGLNKVTEYKVDISNFNTMAVFQAPKYQGGSEEAEDSIEDQEEGPSKLKFIMEQIETNQLFKKDLKKNVEIRTETIE